MKIARLCGRGMVVLMMMAGLGSVPSAPSRAANCPDLADADGFFRYVRHKIHRHISDAQYGAYRCVFKYWSEHAELKDRRWLAYALATAWHESRMHPVREGFGSHEKAIKAARYAWKMGWPKRPYHTRHPLTGKVYYGRGLVQITYAENYLRLGRAIGLGDALFKNPDLALDPEIATRLMFLGMTKGLYRVEKRKSVMRDCGFRPRKYMRAKLGLYFNRRCAKWRRARNMINGDIRRNGSRVAGHAHIYHTALRVIPHPLNTSAPVTEPELAGGMGEGETGTSVAVDDSVHPQPETGGASGSGANSSVPPPEKPVDDEVEVKPTLPGEEPDDKPTVPLTGMGGEAAGGVTSGESDSPSGPVSSTSGSANDNQAGGPAIASGNASSGSASSGNGSGSSLLDAAALDRLAESSRQQKERIRALEKKLDSQNQRIEAQSAQIKKLSNQLANQSAQLENQARKIDGQSQMLDAQGQLLELQKKKMDILISKLSSLESKLSAVGTQPQGEGGEGASGQPREKGWWSRIWGKAKGLVKGSKQGN